MKKSTLALSGLLLTGAAVSAASWYTGKQLESRHSELVTLANHSLKQLAFYGVQAEMQNVKLERGWFSSDVHYQLIAQIGDETHQFKGQDKLYHGPLPLNRLLSGNLLPVLLSGEGKLEDGVLSHQLTMGYSGALSGLIQLKSYQSDQHRLENAQAEFSLNSAGDYQIQLKVPKFTVKDPLVGVEYQGVDYTIKGKKSGENHRYLGTAEQDVRFDSLRLFNDPAKPTFFFRQGKSISRGEFLGENYAVSGDFDTQLSVHQNGQTVEFGQIKLDLASRFNAKALDKFFDDTFRLQAGKITDLPQSTVQAVLNQGQLHFKELSLTNPQGKNQIGLKIQLGEVNLNRLHNTADVLNLFKNSALNINLNQQSLEAFYTQLLSLNPNKRANAEQLAQANVRSFAAQAASSGLVQKDQTSLKLDMAIDGGKLNLNGQTLSPDQLNSLLFFLTIGLNGMGLVTEK